MQLDDLKTINRYIHHPDGVVIINKIVEAIWNKVYSPTTLALCESANGLSLDPWFECNHAANGVFTKPLQNRALWKALRPIKI